ncbi:NepR family anti-sigma factor [Acuticoccus sp. I52.16.1]|uniref:NepR family anti-sigma factor n=1 Tax=Acuticoccus sp. I52.16.1 TaxID=2928472 RepID=UPI001FD06307|nr:NepR family anti-sigma factor [Acuticoccus sp. I52.16.1]UOM34498.1 hypothetical protein MRB58_22230 [Acuticoccus sp. I52.16.1]
MQSLIGKQLRSLYDSVLVEPIPDKLVELLLKLDEVGGDSPSGVDDGEHKAATAGNGEGSKPQ